jgi:Ser-tRNA(Ala) deacylase AlaX
MLRRITGERSFTTHIEKKKSKVDYHFNRNLTEHELKNLEEEVNEVIRKNLPVTERYMEFSKADLLFDLSRLPQDRNTEIRIIEIGDFDSCPCIGQHVDNTSEIGIFKIISSDYDGKKLRIRFKLISKNQ